jgi:hypothetical protein
MKLRQVLILATTLMVGYFGGCASAFWLSTEVIKDQKLKMLSSTLSNIYNFEPLMKYDESVELLDTLYGTLMITYDDYLNLKELGWIYQFFLFTQKTPNQTKTFIMDDYKKVIESEFIIRAQQRVINRAENCLQAFRESSSPIPKSEVEKGGEVNNGK